MDKLIVCKRIGVAVIGLEVSHAHIHLVPINRVSDINFKYKNLDFNVPHVNLVYRNFVLFPLKEILPEWKHPKTNEPIDLIIKKLSDVDKKSILKIKKP